MRIHTFRRHRRRTHHRFAAVAGVGLVAVPALAATATAPAHEMRTDVRQASSTVSSFLWGDVTRRYIVVLGARPEPNGQLPGVLQQRLDRAAGLARRHPVNRVVVSGGATWWLPVTEAQFMNVGLLRRGVPVWQMVNEDRSTSTVENAQNTVGMLAGMGASGAVVVTNQFHMKRALKNFRDAAGRQHADLTFRPAYA
ncbi:YdcF family protein [Gordonia sp. VNK21]|uniref:YdcF family protein n=1 Tax=Gordonia sp. VNK21 TaxID=3382483 RepID=UPI0038D41B42